MQIIDYTIGMPLTWNVVDLGEVELCQHIANDCKRFMDVGARTRSHIVDSVYDSKKEYYLFEPLPEFATELQKAYSRFPNIFIHQFGLGSKDAVLDYYERSQSFVNRPLCKQDKPSSQISVTTLDNFCNKNSIDQIDFLKIDTEGFELEVLLGAKKMLSEEQIRYVQFEYGGTYPDAKITLRDVIARFPQDWSLYLLQSGKLVRIPMAHLSQVETNQYSNFLVTKQF